MLSIKKYILKLMYPKVLSKCTAEEVLKIKLVAEKPLMIARFGSTEIKAVLYPKTPFLLKPLLRRLMNYQSKGKEFLNMKILSGFFPSNEETITLFSRLMYKDMKQLDVLGSWRIEERFLKHHFAGASIVQLDNLEPYFSEEPWSEILSGKNVLVIHPFNKTIERQYYNKRKLLFKDPRVLPEFKSLQTIKAVQTIAGNQSEFNTWFDALEFMKEEIKTKDFDIAIIGCGAYGFPLAAHIKRMGKKAIHLGGATQLLFGIKGKRWVENPKFDTVINEHFCYPMKEDQVNNASKVEEGCYW